MAFSSFASPQGWKGASQRREATAQAQAADAHAPLIPAQPRERAPAWVTWQSRGDHCGSETVIPAQELSGWSPQMPSLRSRFPVELGSVRDPEAQVGRLHRLAVAGGPGWGLTRLLRRVVQVDGENSAGQTGLFLSALLGDSSAVQLLLTFGANPNHRCLDGSTPVHAGAFSGRSLVMLHLLQAGGDLRLHDQQGRTPQDWAEQGGAKQRWELSSLWPLGLVTGIPLADPKELLPAQGEPDRTYESSSHTLMPPVEGPPRDSSAAEGTWNSARCAVGRPSALQIVNPWHVLICAQEQPPPGRSGPPCEWPALLPPSTLHHPNLLLLMALSPSADLSGLCLLFEPVWLGSLHVVLHPRGPSPGGPCTVPGLPPGHLLLQVLEALLFLQARWRAHGGLSSHAVQLVRPGLAKVGSLEHGRPLHQRWLRPRPQQGCSRGGPGLGLPPPPELYPWLPLELICGDMPAATSDLYSFCILAQEVFTGELPWAGRKGPEVKAKLEAGESPALDPLVPAPYQALVQAGLGLGPADRWGSLQNTRYLLREAMAQDPAPEVSSPMHWSARCPVSQGFLPETLYCEVAPRAKSAPRPVPPLMSLGSSPCQALKTPEVTGRSRVQRAPAWDSGSSLTLGSRLSPGPSLYPGSSPAGRVSLHRCLEPSLTEPSPEPIRGGLFSSLQKMDLLEEITAELQGGQLRDKRSVDPAPDPVS
uniref:inactive serine/threonine-protein kinase TEX14-like n=1 Tax=Odobenus rosmarus divergens TaxID=9708 RepID=UPI00063C1112|nr:PREDICTED: inactive serine/threonine-protein kinase TEX14-like [Odobenus rosmarus divergens]